MRRREFITLLGAATAFWPFVARAQQATKLRPSDFSVPIRQRSMVREFSALVQRLHELGWIEGRTIAIEYRWAEGRNDTSPKSPTSFRAQSGRHRHVSNANHGSG